MNPLLKQSDVQVHSECGDVCDAERGYTCQKIKDVMTQRRRISVSLLVLVLLAASLLASSPAGTHDLGGAARQEKDRRAKALAGGPAKSYSTEDLASFHVDQPSAQGKPAAPSKTSTEDALRAEETTRARSEAYWRQRGAEARRAIQDAEMQLTEYRRRDHPCRVWDLPGRRWITCGYDPYLDHLKASLARARQDLDSLEEDARRAGALPGWLRYQVTARSRRVDEDQRTRTRRTLVCRPIHRTSPESTHSSCAPSFLGETAAHGRRHAV
jgi:hypothetical protein